MNLSLGFGLDKYRVQDGTLLNLPEWTNIPLFSMPENGIDVIAGQSITIYGDSLINVPIDNNLSVTYQCAIGSQSGNDYTINHSVLGAYPLNIKFKQDNRLFYEITVNVNIIVVAPGGDVSVIMIGDSLVYSGNSYIASGINAALTPTITFLGSHGTTIKHEGISGSGWQTFATNPDGNPFFKAGVLNVPAYFTDNSIVVPDLILIRLGVNDIFGQCNGAFTDLEITAFINYSKTFINAFLAHSATVKIIIGLPSISENTGAGWNANYGGTPQYKQDSYIEYMHRFWTALINAYDGGAYNSRVLISNESIFLDRNDGYPKTAGVHTNGVHPHNTGYAQLGTGLAISINNQFKDLLTPVASVSWIDDFARISWTDKSAGTCTYEIWENKNNAGYTLVATTAAGASSYDNYTWQNEAMKFKVKAVLGDFSSEFSNELSITTPLVLKTDQSTLNNFVFNYFHINAGKTVNIDWGDGSNNNYSNPNTNLTKVYSVTAAVYYIKITGNVNYIYYFVNRQATTSGDISKWILPADIYYFELNGTKVIGDLSNLVLPPVLWFLNITSNSASVFTGNLSNWSIPASVAFLILKDNDFTKLPLNGHYKNFANGSEFVAAGNNLNQAAVDEWLVYLDTYFTTNTPIKNSKFTINGTGMSAPSAAGLASITSIQGKFTAAGFAATFVKN